MNRISSDPRIQPLKLIPLFCNLRTLNFFIDCSQSLACVLEFDLEVSNLKFVLLQRNANSLENDLQDLLPNVE